MGDKRSRGEILEMEGLSVDQGGMMGVRGYSGRIIQTKGV